MPGELALRPEIDQDSEVRPEGGGAWRSVAEVAREHPDLAATLDARARAAAAWAKVEAARQELAALEGKPAPPPSPPPAFVPPAMFAEPPPKAVEPEPAVVEAPRFKTASPPRGALPRFLAAAGVCALLGLAAGWLFWRRPAGTAARPAAPAAPTTFPAPPETPPLTDPVETPRKMVGILPNKVVEAPPVRAAAPRRKPRPKAETPPSDAAAKAKAATGTPGPVHLPGWKPAPVD